MTRSKSKPKASSEVRLQVEYLPIDRIKPFAGNPRRHAASQIALIAASMAHNGNINPLLIDQDTVIIAGEARWEAAKLAGFSLVPAIRIPHLSLAQRRAYRIADNRLAEKAEWSIKDLTVQFELIAMEEPEYDLGLTGFSLDEIDAFNDNSLDPAPAQDEIVPDLADEVVTRLGDRWAAAGHQLICGDATAAGTYQRLLDRERPDMIFADPPYNVRIDGHVSGLGKHHHREFVQASGEMTDAEFQRFLLAFMMQCARFARAGALHYVCIDWAHVQALLAAGSVAYEAYINLCIWAKTNAGMGSLYRSQHELIAIFKKGKLAHRNNVMLGANGRHRSNVWSYAGMNVPSNARDATLGLHPTVKPIALVRDAILDVTRPGDIVLDPFGGSGTTLLAAHRAGRIARLIELDERYCDVILRRITQALGIMPTLVETGEPFDVVAIRRAAEALHG